MTSKARPFTKGSPVYARMFLKYLEETVLTYAPFQGQSDVSQANIWARNRPDVHLAWRTMRKLRRLKNGTL